MKRIVFTCNAILTLALLGCGSSSKQQSSSNDKSINSSEVAKKYAKTITSEELKTSLYTYASDDFEGRETGTNGQKKAIEYLKQQYQNMNVPSPKGVDNYFQDVPLEKQSVSLAELTINNTPYLSFKDQIVLTSSKSETLKLNDIVYVGYGIDSANYSDYNTIDVKGKFVIAKSGEPKDNKGNYLTTGTKEDTKWSKGRQSLTSKREAAKNNGAKGLIYVDDTLFNTYAPFYKRQAEHGDASRMTLQSNHKDITMLMVSKKFGTALLNTIEEDHTPKIINTNLTISIKHKTESLHSENVLAYIKGTKKPEEIVVISAHLDHEGIKEGQIYNGADDDGSGTVALLEIAEAFKTAKNEGYGPKRSILFLHVTGEEKGLLGSRHYTDNAPIFPLKNTVANLNIDMIGRTDPKRLNGNRNYIYLIGSDKLSTELHEISETVNNKYCNIELDYTYNDDKDPNRFYYRSDHYNFAKNNIPVIFYFNGTHDDYHKPSDTPDKIEYDLLENRTRLVFHTAWEIANRSKRLEVDKASH